MAETFSEVQPKKTDHAPLDYNQAVENSIRSPPLGYVLNSHHLKYTYHFEKEIKIYDPLIDSLEHALSKPLFCCGGSLQPSELPNCVLKVRPTDSEADKDDWEDFTLANLPLDELLKFCNPAPFGDMKQMKTVLDPEVRVAYEIESTRFQIKTADTKFLRGWFYPRLPEIWSIEDRIEENLTPGRRVKLDPYKINVYGKGGFFKPHVDNPSDQDMIGTLVVCLPSPHKGGELLVNHDGLQHVFDFSQQSADTSRIQWAAFYSDCIHEVKPVLEGHRITITYKIFTSQSLRSYHFNAGSADDASLQQFECSSESPSLTSRALANINMELEKIKTQGKTSPSKVGFLLKHKYISKGLQPHLLKGEDKILFDFLVEKQWKCELTSVLSRFQTDAIYPHGYLEDGDLVETHKIYEFKPLESTTPLVPGYDASRRRWAQENYRQPRVGIPFIEIYRKAENAEHLVRNNKGGGSWIGNEVEDVGVDKIYLDSAVIVDLSK